MLKIGVGSTFGRQWDCSSVIDLFFTQYDKFTEEIEIYVYKKIAKVKFYSIKTLICTTRWKVCSNKTIREEPEVFYFVLLENYTQTFIVFNCAML